MRATVLWSTAQGEDGGGNVDRVDCTPPVSRDSGLERKNWSMSPVGRLPGYYNKQNPSQTALSQALVRVATLNTWKFNVENHVWRQGPSRPSLAHRLQHLSRAAPPLPAPRPPERDIDLTQYNNARTWTCRDSHILETRLTLLAHSTSLLPFESRTISLCALARYRPTEPFVFISLSSVPSIPHLDPQDLLLSTRCAVSPQPSTLSLQIPLHCSLQPFAALPHAVVTR